MAKFCGMVGFGITEEDPAQTGVWTERIVLRRYRGDVVRAIRRRENGEGINDNVTVDNSISIVADTFACEHLNAIRFVVWNGIRWKVNSIELQRPRMILSVGGVYNGPED